MQAFFFSEDLDVDDQMIDILGPVPLGEKDVDKTQIKLWSLIDSHLGKVFL